jgi:hypothetical protein
MATTFQKVTDHVNENVHIYRDPRNMITLVLWGLALGLHAFLIPRLISELYHDFKNRK